jgi:hypothetical protein
MHGGRGIADSGLTTRTPVTVEHKCILEGANGESLESEDQVNLSAMMLPMSVPYAIAIAAFDRAWGSGYGRG